MGRDRKDIVSFALQVTLREAEVLQDVLKGHHDDLTSKGFGDTKRGLAVASLIRKLEA